MHPLACAHGSVTLAESTRLLPSRDRQGAVSSEIPKTFKHPLADLGRHTHSWYWYNIMLIRQVLFSQSDWLGRQTESTQFMVGYQDHRSRGSPSRRPAHPTSETFGGSCCPPRP